MRVYCVGYYEDNITCNSAYHHPNCSDHRKWAGYRRDNEPGAGLEADTTARRVDMKVRLADMNGEECDSREGAAGSTGCGASKCDGSIRG